MDKWTDKLSEYIDGELTAQESEALEAHLLECADCGATLHQLRAVTLKARMLTDQAPANDLWSGIAERLTAPSPDRLTAESRPPRRLSFSVKQLVAASIVLMLLSAGSVYLMLTRTHQQQLADATSNNAIRQVSDKPVLENYNYAITELEAALRNNRSQLDTTTVRVLEANLHTIDNAIAEARAALGHDPGNQYLNRYLDETVQKKIQLLRRATGVVRAQT